VDILASGFAPDYFLRTVYCVKHPLDFRVVDQSEIPSPCSSVLKFETDPLAAPPSDDQHALGGYRYPDPLSHIDPASPASHDANLFGLARTRAYTGGGLSYRAPFMEQL
jgi:hypothetical protein